MNVCDRRGWSPYFFHVVDTVKSLTPRCFASSRDDQCVTPSHSGGGSNVASRIRIGSIDSGRPDFARSSKSATPSVARDGLLAYPVTQ